MKTLSVRLVCLLCLLGTPLVTTARTLLVPADYPSIQSAINLASPGDTVLVSPGVYHETVYFAGKDITLLSAGGPDVTRIEPSTISYAVVIENGETTNAMLSGFTLTNAGGGISVAGSSPIIVSNVIVNCGNGVSVSSGSPVIAHNRITQCGQASAAIYVAGVGNPIVQANIIQNNSSSGIFMGSGSGTILIANNLIQGNQGTAIGSDYNYSTAPNIFNANIVQNVIADNAYAGIFFWVPAGSRGPVAVNNTLVNNGYGVVLDGNVGGVKMINNIIFGRNSVYVGASSGLVPFSENNDIYAPDGSTYSGTVTNLAGVNGNISVNPFLACVPSGDYHLLPGSACIDAGVSSAPYLTGTDFDGNPRLRAGSNGPARVDLGAYEFNPAFPPTPCLYVNPVNLAAVTLPGQMSVAVTYPTIDATPGAAVTCTPPSGSVFPAGTNTVLCTATYGTNVLTNSFTVTVDVPPSITNLPSIVTVLACGNATLSVGGFSTQPISYSWSFNGNVIYGETNSQLVITNAQAVNQGYYQVTLANSLGTTNSPIILRVLPRAAQITDQPASQSLPAGGTAVLAGSAIGSQPLTLQWYKDNAVLYGATSSQLVISNAQAADAGVYQLVASNYLGAAFSTKATLTVLPSKPWFILQPVSAWVAPGGSVEFTSLAGGSSDFTSYTNILNYSWYFQGAPLSGETGNNLWLSSITTNNQGDYFVVAANAYGQTTSDIVRLNVYPPPVVTAALTNVVADEGGTVSFSVGATGAPSFTYSWSFNYLPLTNQTATLTLSNVTPAQSGFYAVTVSTPYGSASSTARLSVFLPASRVVAWGDNSGGQTAVPTNLLDAVAVAGGDYSSLALHHDGTITSWGADALPVPTNALRYVALSAGGGHALAILEDGTPVAWGNDDLGQTEPPSFTTAVVSVAAGDAHSLALLASGQVVAWGDNSHSQLNLPWDLHTISYWTNSPTWQVVTLCPNPVQAIAAHGDHNLALLTNGTVVAWGDNAFGESTVPPDLTNAVAVAAGYAHSVALRADGTVVAWGDNTFGQTNVPPGLTNVAAIAAGDYHTLALLSNGRVVGWGDDSFGQLDAPAGLSGVVSITSGYFHNLTLMPARQLAGRSTSNHIVLDWGAGILQSAPTPAGPYTDLPSADGTYTNATSLPASARFYRVRY